MLSRTTTIIRIAAMMILACPPPTWAQQRLSAEEVQKLEKDLTKIVRENFAETTKNYCIGHWSSSENAKALSRFATISEHCRCVTDELNYLANDNLARGILDIQIQTANPSSQKMSEDDIKATLVEWNTRYQTANRFCGEKARRKSLSQ